MSLVHDLDVHSPSFQPWWKDLPLEWIHSIALETSKAEVENNLKMNTKSLRFRGAVSKWDSLMRRIYYQSMNYL